MSVTKWVFSVKWLDFSKMDIKNSKKEWFGSIITSRGCPYKCTYCSSTAFWKRRVRTRTSGNILAELKHLKNEYNLKTFTFWDDSFGVNLKVIKELCEKINNDKLEIS